MIPTTISEDDLIADIEEVILPSYDYKLDETKQEIKGFVSEIEELKQAIYKILSTERYKYVIYSFNYGIELSDLFGQPPQYVCPELQRRITDALSVDDRITGINNFDFDIEQDIIKVKFDVNTIFGETKINYSLEV